MSNEKLILIVDDEELNVELLTDLLQDEGYRTSAAADGREALALLESIEPDLILLDVMMPVLDGYATCQQIRELEQDDPDPTPIIFLSAKANIEDKLKGYAAGGDDYVTKPFENEELLAKVESTLKKYEAIAALRNQAQQAQSMTFQMMTNAAKVGTVGRFLLDSLECRSIEQLVKAFFELCNQFELPCTLRVKQPKGDLILSHDGIDRPLDIEIIKNYTGHEKIFHFGKNRALFSWGDVTLLVRNVADEADTIAIMMDGLLAGYRSIMTQNVLIKTINAFRTRNQNLVAQSAKTLDDLNDELRILFNEFGSGSTLREDEENAISALVDKHRSHLDRLTVESRQLENMLNQALSAFQNSTH